LKIGLVTYALMGLVIALGIIFGANIIIQNFPSLSKQVITRESSVAADTGVLVLMITDAPPSSRLIEKLYIAVDDVVLHRDVNGSKLNFPVMSREINLLELRGVEELLGSQQVPAGNYSMIEFRIASAKALFQGETQNATLRTPSNSVKIQIRFQVHPGQTTVVTLDIQPEGVHVNPNDVLRPVVKVKVKHLP